MSVWEWIAFKNSGFSIGARTNSALRVRMCFRFSDVVEKTRTNSTSWLLKHVTITIHGTYFIYNYINGEQLHNDASALVSCLFVIYYLEILFSCITNCIKLLAYWKRLTFWFWTAKCDLLFKNVKILCSKPCYFYKIFSSLILNHFSLLYELYD